MPSTRLRGFTPEYRVDDDGKFFGTAHEGTRSHCCRLALIDPHFDASNVGEYLQAAGSERHADDPDALFIDMRNHYESSEVAL